MCLDKILDNYHYAQVKQEIVDVKYDYRKDSKYDDPDKDSRKLKYMHKLLWNKILPNGELFKLNESNYYTYHLIYYSDTKSFRLSSDTMNNTYNKPTWYQIYEIIKNVPSKNIEHFQYLIHTIGNYILFPVQIDNIQHNNGTINIVRGKHGQIHDRFDLTLECIRLFYLNKTNPLDSVFNNYSEYFTLFKNFKCFCDFFLLQDLVTNDYQNINFFIKFKDFDQKPLPQNKTEYIEFMNSASEFIIKRNCRINEWLFENNEKNRHGI